jgi:hypothetical protein
MRAGGSALHLGRCHAGRRMLARPLGPAHLFKSQAGSAPGTARRAASCWTCIAAAWVSHPCWSPCAARHMGYL